MQNRRDEMYEMTGREAWITLAIVVGAIALVFAASGIGVPKAWAQTTLNPTAPIGPYPQSATPDMLTVNDFIPGEVGEDYVLHIPSVGAELLLIGNNAPGGATISIFSVNNRFNRKSDILSYPLFANETMAFWWNNKVGWAIPGGSIVVQASGGAAFFKVFRIQK